MFLPPPILQPILDWPGPLESMAPGVGGMTDIRLVRILVESNVLSFQQVACIVAEQDATGEPFGLLAERLFGGVGG